MSIKQISIFLENKPGTLNDMTKVLADNGIDMHALSLSETEGFGLVRIIVEDVVMTANVLRDAGYVNRVTPVVLVEIPDETGGLARVLQLFKDAEVNLDYMYAMLGGKTSGHAWMIFKVNEVKAAEAVMRKNGIRLIEQEDIAEM